MVYSSGGWLGSDHSTGNKAAVIEHSRFDDVTNGIINPNFIDDTIAETKFGGDDSIVDLSVSKSGSIDSDISERKLGRNKNRGHSEDDEQFRSLVPFCIIFGVGSLLSQSVTVYLSSQITVLERAFGLSSLQSGVLLSANDLGFVLTVLLASHFLKQ